MVYPKNSSWNIIKHYATVQWDAEVCKLKCYDINEFIIYLMKVCEFIHIHTRTLTNK